MNRRDFIAGSVLSTFGLANVGHAIANSTSDVSCIFVYLHGGISHIDFTHPGVDVPEEYRSVKGVVRTNAGYSLAGSFTNLSKIGNKLSVVRSFAHRDANHSTAAGWINTGHNMLGVAEGGPQKEPSYGSVVSRIVGDMNSHGVPSYIKTSKIDFGARRDGSAWLGSKHIGFDIDEEGIRNLQLGVDKNRGNDRMRIVEMIDRKDSALDREWTQLRRNAYNIAQGPAGDVFNLKLEKPDAIKRFNSEYSKMGKDCLMAVRAVQNGARFVTVVNGGWDMHSGILNSFNAKGEDLDYMLYTLIQELELRDLLEKTLVVITTEFGRTPKINKDDGRDHWNSLIPLVFAGGGYNHGRVIGTCDVKNEAPTSKKFEPKDLCRTILNHYSINIGDKVIDNLNRPRYLIEDGSSNILS